MSNNQIRELLLIILIFMIFIFIGLVCAYVFIKLKNKTKEKEQKITSNNKVINNNPTAKTGTYKGYTKQSIFNFLEFDKITDNMISQKNGFRYLMVVNCQGVNYDLMSNEEKIGVEQGFVEFLNTLRFPIQIYTQTRTVNLEGSISTYQKRVREEEEKLNRMRLNYEQMVKNNTYSKEELQAAYFELTKQTNLCEYGKDIIENTEKMSLNKSVLNKQYYVVVPYYPSELGQNSFDREEIENIAFSELYTRAQTIISALLPCGVNGRILNSNELLELLYMAYNRDEAEIFGLDKILKIGYEQLYSTAPDVIDKKMQELDRKIEIDAIKLAQEKVYEVRSEKQRKLEKKEKTLDDLIKLAAKKMIDENERYIGKDTAERAKEKIDKNSIKKVEEGAKDEYIKKKRGRKPKSI